jgi:sporulation protein YlmC with PRC-barrel domain
MDNEKRHSSQLIGKKVVSKSGKEYGIVSNIIFEVRTGEILQIALRHSTGYCEGLDLERSKQGEPLIPFNAVAAIGDFIVVAEEDLM